jgi:5-methylcytosine-specific restriction endonuclease McrA
MPKPGAKERIRHFFRANIGNVVTSIQVRNAAGPGVSEWARRVRELREDENWPILTHNDSTDLKPGQYLLKEIPPEKSLVKFSRPISAKLRAEVLDRNGFTCQMCGLAPGEIDPSTGRKVRLHIGHIKDKSLGGKDELSNLRALCSTCNQGAKNITGEKPSVIWLLSQIRRAGQDEQRAVFDWLLKKFGER